MYHNHMVGRDTNWIGKEMIQNREIAHLTGGWKIDSLIRYFFGGGEIAYSVTLSQSWQVCVTTDSYGLIERFKCSQAYY